LYQIKKDRKQINMLSAARSKKEEEYWEEEERLTKETEKAIACLSMRELADHNLKDVLSKLTELIGEFKEEDEFEELIRQVDRESAYNTKKRG
jgi:tRNA U34 5-carboxymethylaminomethyl modifying GTPase MnmE/TrmE